MAASDTQISAAPSPGSSLPADVLVERVEEEIARAERHHTPLSCLLVGLEGLGAIEQTHGKHLSEQAVAYVGLILRHEFRRYDRVGATNEHDHLVVLPGADGARGEIVARRALGRLRQIKIEAQDERHALPVTVGIATWRKGQTAGELIERAGATAGRGTSPRSSLPIGPLGFRDALGI